MSYSQKTFQENLVRIRKALDMTQRQLAEAALIKPLSRIAAMEEGRARASLDEVMDICRTLRVPIEKMMHEKAVVKIDFQFIYPKEEGE